MRNSQTRLCETDIRTSQDNDGALTIRGRAIKYDTLSELHVPSKNAREKIARGAFTQSLRAKTRVDCDFNHSNEYLPLGSTRNGTLELTDEDDGLYFRVKMNPGVMAHRDLYELVRSGVLGECSFTFSGADDSWEDAWDERNGRYSVRTVRKATLHGVSIVQSPAYGNGATFAEARSLSYRFATPTVMPQVSGQKDAIDDLKKKVEEIGFAIAKDMAEAIKSAGFAVWVRTGSSDADGYFRAPTDEEIDSFHRKRAAEIGEIVAADQMAITRDRMDREWQDKYCPKPKAQLYPRRVWRVT